MNNADISVLLVDDDEMIRDCVAAYLEDEGFSVHSADSAEAALDSIAALSPSVCISDLRLPGMNGDEFIIRAHSLCPATGYLLHTGMLYSLSDELRAIGMTFEDVLLKPIHELSLLVDKILQIVAKQGEKRNGNA
jgi:two-component system OmpR family response regulator